MDQAVCGLKIPYTPAALSTRVPFPSETEISVTYGGLDKTPGGVRIEQIARVEWVQIKINILSVCTQNVVSRIGVFAR